jgi:diguanylate cyclase (GGDEF)-like protein
VALVDLDRFADYNEIHGRRAGDLLLRDAAAAWQHRVESRGAMARLAGDRFAVRLAGLALPEAVELVGSLRAATPSGQTFSAGLAQWLPGTHAGSVVDAAALALADAKRFGGDRLEYTRSHTSEALSEELRAVQLVLQPIVSAATGEVFGYETLSRFGHSSDVAAVFAQAHREGHGDVLEAFVVARAFDRPGRPESAALFLNVTASALRSPRFWAELPPSLDGVVMELVEDESVVDWNELAPLLKQLTDRGAWLAVDDLGAGAGDLRRLLTIRPKVVKVDRDLVHGCAADRVRADLIKVVVELAHASGALVCAEGVERPADLRRVRVLGVDLLQGFLFARPGPVWLPGPFDIETLVEAVGQGDAPVWSPS